MTPIRRSSRGKSIPGKENIDSSMDDSVVYENTNTKHENHPVLSEKHSMPLHEGFCTETPDTSIINQKYPLQDVEKVKLSSEIINSKSNIKKANSNEDIHHIVHTSHLEETYSESNEKLKSVVIENRFSLESRHSSDSVSKDEKMSCHNLDRQQVANKSCRTRFVNIIDFPLDYENSKVAKLHPGTEFSCTISEFNGNAMSLSNLDNKQLVNKSGCNRCANIIDNPSDLIKLDATLTSSDDSVADKTEAKASDRQEPCNDTEKNECCNEDKYLKEANVSSSVPPEIHQNQSYTKHSSKSLEGEVNENIMMLENMSDNKSEVKKVVTDNNNSNIPPETETTTDMKEVSETSSKQSIPVSLPRGNSPTTQVQTSQETNTQSSLSPNSSVLNLKVTDEMIKEEAKMEAEDESELEEVRRKTLEELKRTGQQQRFDRLQVLLNRSNLYATYLLERMQDREKIEKKKQEKLKEKKAKNENDAKSKEKNERPVRRGRTKRKLEDYNFEKLENDQKKVKTETGSANKKSSTEKKKVKTEDDNENPVPIAEKAEPVSLADLYSNRRINGDPVDTRQPLLITGGVMREYQLDGMSWLRGLFEHGINGILADEMGLGKTIQSIALIASLIENRVVGPFIIVAPLSTLPNWISEFKKFAPEIFTVLYHGNMDHRAILRRKLMRLRKYSHGLRSLPVIVTSYEIAMRDRAPLSAFGHEWKYMIVDEGHRIKNLNCKLIRALKSYRVANRLLLTGTPLQNNLSELWSLLNFLLPDIFDDLNSFQSWFDFSAMENNEHLIAQEQEAKVLQTLHSILTPFLLRRLKTDVDLSIPPKKEVLVYAPLTKQQQQFYKATLDKSIIGILEKNQKAHEEKVEYSESGRVVRKSRKSVKYDETEDDSQEFDFDALLKEMEDEEKRQAELKEAQRLNKKTVTNIKMQNILMQLRKCVNHPYLIEFPFNPETNELIINEKLVEASGKLLLIDRMLPALFKQDHKVLIFSQMTQMLDIIADYCDIRSFKYSRIDGAMNVQERQDNIESFNNDNDRNLFLLSTRAGGLGLNLMAADTCIIFDSDWNPQCDLQAQDRCHRIGQKKPVVVFRLVTANTVDERIIERAASKRKLEKMVIHKKNFKGRSFARAITPSELLELLDSKDVSCTVGNTQDVLTDAQLELLLDRSDLLEEMNNTKKNSNTSPQKSSENTCTNIFKVLDTNTTEELVF